MLKLIIIEIAAVPSLADLPGTFSPEKIYQRLSISCSIDNYCYTRLSEDPAQRGKAITSAYPGNKVFKGGPECLV